MCQLLVVVHHDGNRIYDFIAQKYVVICAQSRLTVGYFPRFYSCAVFLKNLSWCLKITKLVSSMGMRGIRSQVSFSIKLLLLFTSMASVIPPYSRSKSPDEIIQRVTREHDTYVLSHPEHPRSLFSTSSGAVLRWWRMFACFFAT